MSRIADAGKRLEWARRLAQHERRGETVAEFCRRHRVSQATFYYWKRRASTPEAGRIEPADFIPVRVRNGDAAGRIEIKLPNGVVVFLPADIAASTLREAIQASAGRTAGGASC